ncbi:MAG: (2Fe-2S)-binding protein [Desulfobacterales bacterium]|nr:(2Fe-2S)-binding protein [Desulfobacterales bacterium]
MTDNLRIHHHPVVNFNHGKQISIRFNGRPVPAYEGETIAAALYASGIRIFSRSMKYHRPRGLYCLSGHCSQCLMRVNGEPNVRVCQTIVKENMVIESQNAWPSLQFDIAAIAGKLDFLIRPGFYYRYLIKPRWLYHIWERFLRNAAGIGKIADNSKPPSPVKRIQASPQVLVIGGGIAGMSAALNAVRSGAEVWLVEKEGKLGGRLQYDTREFELPEKGSKKYAFEYVVEMANKLANYTCFHLLTNTTAFGWYEEDVIAATGPGKFWEFEPQCTIIATGSYETPPVFENNDLPGIFLSTGIQRLMHRDGVLPGKQTVVISSSNEGYVIAKQLYEAGISVLGIAESRSGQSSNACPEKDFILSKNIPVFHSHKIKSAIGKKQVKGVVLESLPDPANSNPGTETKIACDTICISGSRAPANDLLFQHGCGGTYIINCPDHFIRKPEVNNYMSVSDGLYAAGEAGGSNNIKQSFIEGKIAGLSATKYLGIGDRLTDEKLNIAVEQLQR